MFRCHNIAARYTTDSTVIAPVITRLGCCGSNTIKTACNSLLELMTVSAQLGFNSWGFNNSMHRYLQKKSIHPQPVLMKWDFAVGEAAFYEIHRLTRFHKREIVVAKQQPETRGGLNYIRKIYEKEMAALWPEKHYGER
ncbi:hypothetical protein CAPTEDRAFT_212260 [Capitella teleta]|uniref:Uncharacterized protein n=1 Tax=Capitella teleta TaxID=283909 RepID=R7TCG6_CAPTE|nr:hypothetical protein CAPTEDRAFT_212260 [Capitella teleta]|eukprot:ELT89187.1 hypothetical protein CAPTEDRAFT_212260 [Capitella teleta]